MLLRGSLGIVLALALAACGSKTADQKQQQKSTAAAGQVLKGDEAGVTPMAQRVAVIGVLNKRNGLVKTVALHPGQSARWKEAMIHLRACETTAPWEAEQLTGAFVQLDIQGRDKQWRRVFSGWVYKESPSLNVVENAVYDVWPKSCAMSFPPGPPPPPGVSVDSSNGSSAQKSPGRKVEAPSPSPSPSAEANNAE